MNTKTILILGAVTIGGFLVYKMVNTHTSTAAPANPQNNSTVTAGNQTVATAGAAAAAVLSALNGDDDTESGS